MHSREEGNLYTSFLESKMYSRGDMCTIAIITSSPSFQDLKDIRDSGKLGVARRPVKKGVEQLLEDARGVLNAQD